MVAHHTDKVYDSPDSLRTTESGKISPHVIQKPWGKEELLVLAQKYVMKILHVNPGERLSVQYHEKKTETLYVLEGEGILFLGDSAESMDELQMTAGAVFHITPGAVHAMQATTQLKVMEASTPEVWDVVRVDDKYGREAS